MRTRGLRTGVERQPARALALGLALALGTSACATASRRPAPAPAPAPVPTTALPDGPAELRYNPPRCACPPWELRLGDGWERMFVDDASPDLAFVGALVEEAGGARASDGHGTWLVAATLTTQVRRDQVGHRHRVLSVTGPWEPEPVPEDEPEPVPEDEPEPPPEEEPAAP